MSTPTPPKAKSSSQALAKPKPSAKTVRKKASVLQVAVIGAGMAGIACARTLKQAGHNVTVFEKSHSASGRMSTRSSGFGSFDHGAQYFTVRDKRFAKAINQTTPEGMVLPWQASESRAKDARYVAVPGMSALVKHWAHPLGASLLTGHTVNRVSQHAAGGWDVACTETTTLRHFDAVVIAVPSVQAEPLLRAAQANSWAKAVADVAVHPCWTLMVAFPNAAAPSADKTAFGPLWHSARPDHARVAWVSREASKPGRGAIERWTLQATPKWSREHVGDDANTVKAKLLKAFAEVTGIRAEPAHAEVHRWLYAKTDSALGKPFLWDADASIGVCGDWCTGHRVEDAFASGLDLALTMVKDKR